MEDFSDTLGQNFILKIHFCSHVRFDKYLVEKIKTANKKILVVEQNVKNPTKTKIDIFLQSKENFFFFH